MVVVDGAIATAAARVRQVSPDGALEETLAALARQLPVVPAGALVSADDAFRATAAAGSRRRGKSAGDVTAPRNLLFPTATAVVAAAGAVANGNGRLLSEVWGTEHRSRRRYPAAVHHSGTVNLQQRGRRRNGGGGLELAGDVPRRRYSVQHRS